MKYQCVVCKGQYVTSQALPKLVPNVCKRECLKVWIERVAYPIILPPISVLEARWMKRIEAPVTEYPKSVYESVFVEFLIRNRFSFVYEPYLYKDVYVPDLLVGDTLFVELKGKWFPKAKAKVYDFAEVMRNREYAVAVLDGPFMKRVFKC